LEAREGGPDAQTCDAEQGFDATACSAHPARKIIAASPRTSQRGGPCSPRFIFPRRAGSSWTQRDSIDRCRCNATLPGLGGVSRSVPHIFRPQRPGIAIATSPPSVRESIAGRQSIDARRTPRGLLRPRSARAPSKRWLAAMFPRSRTVFASGYAPS
jgi:hypothetical protein